MTVMYWLGAAAIFVVIEIITMGLTTIWFAGGALVGAVMAAFSLPLWSQIIAFVIVSVILLILTRPWALKYLNSRTVRTNADSLIGQTALVTQDIDNLNAKGQVKVEGQIWTARSISDDVQLHEGQKVMIESISGVKVIKTDLKMYSWNFSVFDFVRRIQEYIRKNRRCNKYGWNYFYDYHYIVNRVYRNILRENRTAGTGICH